MGTNALNGLVIEHQCLLSQAREIGDQIGQVRAGSNTDYLLLADRVRFLKRQYIQVHHPKDDAVIQKLVGDDDCLDAVMSPFLNAHAAAFLRGGHLPVGARPSRRGGVAGYRPGYSGRVQRAGSASLSRGGVVVSGACERERA